MSNASAGVNANLLARLPLTARRVLDIGCGVGDLGRAYKAYNPGAAYVGVEPSQAAADVARERLDRVVGGDIDRDETLAALDAAASGVPFDLLVLGAGLDGLGHPRSVMARLRERIAPGGTCVVCSPDWVRWARLGPQDRPPLRVSAREDALALIAQAGWSIADVTSWPRWPDEAAQALEANAAALGAHAEAMSGDPAAYQWVIRALNGPAPAPLVLSAMTLSRAGGITDVRIEEPLAALRAQPRVTAEWRENALRVPSSGPAGVLIFQRQYFRKPEILASVEDAAARGWALVSEIDDDPRGGLFEEHDYRVFRAVHAVTVSTEPLAALIRQWNPHVAVFPNAVARLTETSPSTPKRGGRLRVFFGAFNRSGDWAGLIEGLNPALDHLAGDVEMVVVHDRAFHDALPPNVRREFHDTLPYGAYKALLASCDIALLPLADTAFNRHKSDLKLIECCAAGVVPICSPVVYADDPRNAEVAVMAADAPAFAQALADLCGDLPRLAALRARGLRYVAGQRMGAHQVAAREAFYRGLVETQPMLEIERRARMAKSPN